MKMKRVMNKMKKMMRATIMMKMNHKRKNMRKIKAADNNNMTKNREWEKWVEIKSKAKSK
jgi:hypothetical protein